MDTDDEVRDRATYYSNILSYSDPGLYENYIIQSPQVSIASLERSLREYIQGDGLTAFDLKSVPLQAVPTPSDIANQKAQEGMLVTNTAAQKKPQVSREENFAAKLSAIPGIQQAGSLFRSSDVVELTESETEYVVRCIKHCYSNFLVLQFDCLNTLADQLLENVRVQLDPSEGYKIISEIPCLKLCYNETGSTFIVLQFPEDLSASVATFGAVLKFDVKDCDPSTGLPDSEDSYHDEYMLEDLEITLGDQIQRVNKANWGLAWEDAASNMVEMDDTYSLSTMGSLEEAIKNIIQFLGLQPSEQTDRVQEGKTTHTLLLAGVFRGGFDILVRAKLALAEGVTMQLTVRSPNSDVVELVTSAVG